MVEDLATAEARAILIVLYLLNVPSDSFNLKRCLVDSYGKLLLLSDELFL